MQTFVRVVLFAPQALCALVFVGSLDEPVAHAQLAPDSASTRADARSFPHERGGANVQSGPPERGDGRGPPPAAYEACADKAQGDDCSVSLGDRTIEGRCITGLDEKLFCLPDGMPPAPPGDGHGPPPEGRR